MAPIAMAATAIGTGMQVYSGIRQGQLAEKIGKQRAAVDRMRADRAFENSMSESERLAERRKRLIAQNLSQMAAGNVMINSPMGIAATKETERVINQDISDILRRGRQEKADYLYSAEMEEEMGKARKRQSVWDAVGTGAQGAGSIAWMGYEAGMWGKGANRDAYLASKHGIS
jgi:hypothetical protein